MRGMGNMKMKVLAILVIVSTLNAGCSLSDFFARLCAVPVFLVTKTADTNDGLCTSADCSLREAVLWSNACPGVQTVQIPAGTYTLTRTGVGEDADSTGDLDVTDSAHILGVGGPVVDGNHTDRVFEIMAGKTVDMDGMRPGRYRMGYAMGGDASSTVYWTEQWIMWN